MQHSRRFLAIYSARSTSSGVCYATIAKTLLTHFYNVPTLCSNLLLFSSGDISISQSALVTSPRDSSVLSLSSTRSRQSATPPRRRCTTISKIYLDLFPQHILYIQHPICRKDLQMKNARRIGWIGRSFSVL